MTMARIALAVFLVVRFTQPTAIQAFTHTQAGAPLSMTQLRELLAVGAPDSAIAGELQSRGVSFTIDRETIADLEKAGAGPKALAVVRLLQPKGTLVVRANLGGVNVYVGDVMVGSTGADGELRVQIPAGSASVVVKKAGYFEIAAIATTVERERESTVRATLERIPVRVGGNIRPPAKLKHVDAVYPNEARSSGAQGIVLLELTIGVDGTVKEAKPLRPIPKLTEAAIAAAKQWVFAPTLLDGEAVPALLTATVQFMLPR